MNENPAAQEWRHPIRRVAVVVAHPDDETLWCGGLLLAHPEWSVVVVSLCRGNDPDRAPKFYQALQCYHATGRMGDLDDGPEQSPLPDHELRAAILGLLPEDEYDLLLTHGLQGEYTRHRRHEETARALGQLWEQRLVRAGWLWRFAYHDENGTTLPVARPNARLQFPLTESLWRRKHAVITEVYGFDPMSWEARAVPATEAFSLARSPAPASAGALTRMTS